MAKRNSNSSETFTPTERGTEIFGFSDGDVIDTRQLDSAPVDTGLQIGGGEIIWYSFGADELEFVREADGDLAVYDDDGLLLVIDGAGGKPGKGLGHSKDRDGDRDAGHDVPGNGNGYGHDRGVDVDADDFAFGIILAA